MDRIIKEEYLKLYLRSTKRGFDPHITWLFRQELATFNLL